MNIGQAVKTAELCSQAKHRLPRFGVDTPASSRASRPRVDPVEANQLRWSLSRRC